MSKLWNLFSYVKWYYFATMVNKQLCQQKKKKKRKKICKGITKNSYIFLYLNSIICNYDF